jgi:uncharacterized protein (DUF952 family)
LFKFQLDQFTDPVKWEDEFPHLYGNFGAKDIVSVQSFDKAQGQTWAESMSTSSWLE